MLRAALIIKTPISALARDLLRRRHGATEANLYVGRQRSDSSLGLVPLARLAGPRALVWKGAVALFAAMAEDAWMPHQGHELSFMDGSDAWLTLVLGNNLQTATLRMSAYAVATAAVAAALVRWLV